VRIDHGTRWVMFEPNDEPLCGRVRRSVSNFLLTIWREGAPAGADATEASRLSGDPTRMTPTDIEGGRVI
jgi:uncharacterized protein